MRRSQAGPARTIVALRTALLLVLAVCGPSSLRKADAAEIVSNWAEGFNNKARLIAGTVQIGSDAQAPRALAGLEIAMSPGFKTYWRNPGEAGGIPPEFDFSGSENVADVRVLYPAPHRTKDKAGENIAYKDDVILPIVFVATEPAKPVTLKLKAAYGVCKDICIPAEAELSLVVPADAQPSALLASALAAIPAPGRDPSAPVPASEVPLDATPVLDPAKDPQITQWRLERVDAKAKLSLDAKDPGGRDLDAFLFSPDGLYMPMTARVAGSAQFTAELTEGASLAELAGKRISVTLVGALGQSETFLQLPSDLTSH